MRILKATLFFVGFLFFIGGMLLFVQSINLIDHLAGFNDLDAQQRFMWVVQDRYSTFGLMLIVGTLLIGFFQDWNKESKK